MESLMNSQLFLSIATVAGIVLIAAVGVLLCRQFRINARRRERDMMDGFDFEYYCADLLADSGFINVKVTRRSGDYGVDILAEKDGVTYAIQCKRYSGLVGIKAVQEAYAGRDYYDRMVGAVLTNQYFTKSAVQAARKLKILLWDRDYLQEMEKN
ncbi:MAG: restriction endonuclease [Lachnospiraceae bacterium]|nr:restriction endonuclease [Lachnospiraceae bacterium]